MQIGTGVRHMAAQPRLARLLSADLPGSEPLGPKSFFYRRVAT
jgi:hypothetical protein